ncbi:MAG: DUF4392 domain-containing protein [Thermoplasmata archaeon]|nr:DUF4392 domain-containing protein [Candidatus Sysuiplasma jiujiangense]
MNGSAAMEISEHIDRLVSTDFHSRKFIIDLYDAARRQSGNIPLTYRAASLINEKVRPDSCVLFITGFPTYGDFVAEQDGPVGASMLSRVLSELLRVRPVVLTDASQAWMVEKCFMGCGFSLAGRLGEEHQVVVRGFKENTEIDFSSVFDEFSPSAIVAIERPSKNSSGRYMSMKGMDISSKVARLDDILNEAPKRGIPTVGVGDGGNEAGCGLIEKEVIKFHPNGRIIASAVGTDALVFSSVSNFGAYGIAGALAAISGDFYALPDKQTLISALKSAATAGLHNGPPKWLDPGSDGIPFELEGLVWEGIRRMIWEKVNPHYPRFY